MGPAPSIVFNEAQEGALLGSARNTSNSTLSAAPANTTSANATDPSGSSSPSFGPGALPTPMLIAGVICGVVQLITIIIIVWQWQKIRHLRSRLMSQQKQSSGLWGVPNGPGAARGFGWGAPSTPHSHLWAADHSPVSPDSLHPRSLLHRHQCDCISPDSTMQAPAPAYRWSRTDSKSRMGYHEMDARDAEVLEKELTLAPLEKDATPRNVKPFERKWFTLGR